MLVVEDDPALLRAIRRELSSTFDVVAVGTGADGISAIHGASFEAIVTDLDLGAGPTGADLLCEAQIVAPRTALVLVSGSGDAGTIAATIGVAYVAKPWRTGELVRVTTHAIHLARGTIPP